MDLLCWLLFHLDLAESAFMASTSLQFRANSVHSLSRCIKWMIFTGSAELELFVVSCRPAMLDTSGNAHHPELILTWPSLMATTGLQFRANSVHSSLWCNKWIIFASSAELELEKVVSKPPVVKELVVGCNPGSIQLHGFERPKRTSSTALTRLNRYSDVRREGNWLVAR